MEATLLTVLGVITAAVLTVGGVVLTNISSRLRNVETDLANAQSFNRRLWLWARKHLDLYYRHRLPGAPDPDPVPEED